MTRETAVLTREQRARAVGERLSRSKGVRITPGQARALRRPRRKPYTEEGIKRLACVRCGAPARTQWQVCGDGNQYRPICEGCDVALNEMVMAWVGLPFDADAYRARQFGRTGVRS